MGDRRAKDELFEGFATVGKAISSGRRIEILDLLDQGERSVEAIAAELHQSVANTSHHLRTLAGAGLVRARREGTRVYYGLGSEEVSELCRALRRAASRHVAEVERLAEAYLGDRSELDVLSRSELLERLERGEATVIDVRPEPEYGAGHIAGARPMPLEGLRRRLRTLPTDEQIVAYCRGPYCVYADDAVRLLRSRGFRAARLEDGFPEWKRAGLPVATGKEIG